MRPRYPLPVSVCPAQDLGTATDPSRSPKAERGANAAPFVRAVHCPGSQSRMVSVSSPSTAVIVDPLSRRQSPAAPVVKRILTSERIALLQSEPT
jgi:hypothetical protein